MFFFPLFEGSVAYSGFFEFEGFVPALKFNILLI